MSEHVTRRLALTCGIGAALIAVAAGWSPASAAQPAVPAPVKVRWVGTWESAQVQPGTSGLSATGFTDETVRNVIHTSAGGSEIRVRLSNVFGTRPLVIKDVHVALRKSGAATVPGTTRAVEFGGKHTITIPAGGRVDSDPVKLKIAAESNLAVSIYFAGASGPATWHPDAISTNYYSGAGDHSADTSATHYSHTDTSWFFLDGVDVVNPAVRGAVVTFGPSTTDGTASTLNANERYPDDLARRLLALAPGRQMSVLNAGISGNQLLAGGGTSGPSALSRFVRDAINQTDVKTIIIWEGTNDIGADPALSLSNFTDAYRRLIDIAHAHGIKVIGATLQPDEGASYWTTEGNALREAVNHWILTSGSFDGTANFSTVLRNPDNPAELLPGYDSGDHLHPNDAGYRAIAGLISLSLLTTGRA
jgi:lysophospholipase L1-like esterase